MSPRCVFQLSRFPKGAHVNHIFSTLAAFVGLVPARNSLMFETPSPSESSLGEGQNADLDPQYILCQSSGKPSGTPSLPVKSSPHVVPAPAADNADRRPPANT